MDRIDELINKLIEYRSQYDNLYGKRKNVSWRLDALQAQIDILLDLKKNTNDVIKNWEICLKEDNM